MELDRLAALFGRAPVAKQAEGARRALLALASALTREGWQLARQGERAHALERLREAKALGQGASRSP